MDADILAGAALLLARPGMLIAAAPVFGGQFAPPHVRAGLALLFAVLLMPTVPVPATLATVGLGIVVARELAIGLALAMGVRALIAGAELGGQLTSSQLMLSYGSTIDPQGGVRNSMVGSLYGNLALLTFFAINGHHALVRALTASYVALPIGAGGIDTSLPRGVMQLLGVVFVFGLRVAAPVLAVMLVVELASGLVSRAAPALNLMAVSMPIRVIVGLAAMAAVVPLLPGLSARFATLSAGIGVELARAFR